MDRDVIDLHAQAMVMRRRWRVIVLVTLLGLAAAYALAFSQTPTYVARNEILVNPLSSQIPANGIPVQPEEVSTQLEVLASAPVAKRVIDDLGLSDSPSELLRSVEVTSVDETRVLSLEVTRTDAADAGAIADSFGESYLAARKEGAENQANASRVALSDEFSGLQALLAEVETQLETVDDTERASLLAQRQGLLLQLTQLSSQISTLNTTGVGNIEGGEVLEPAVTPSNPASPRTLRLCLLGGFIGLLLGIGLAYVRDRYDDALRDERRLDEATGARPILGHIPRWSGAADRVISIVEPQSPASEAYRALSANVRFLLAATPAGRSVGKVNRTLLISSAGPGEGKTSAAANLAVAAAGVGLRVVVVDADLRQPRLSRLFGLGDAPGLSDVLADEGLVRDHLIDVGVENLRVLPGGSAPPNPAELLASPAAQALIRQLRKDCDLLILDSAPILRVADSLELVSDVELVLLVARNGVTRLRALTATIERVRQVGGDVAGVVFNDLAPRASGFSPGYHALPSSDPDKPGWLFSDDIEDADDSTVEAASDDTPAPNGGSGATTRTAVKQVSKSAAVKAPKQGQSPTPSRGQSGAGPEDKDRRGGPKPPRR